MTKVAYFDCASGISGDMTLGAMIDAGVDPNQLNDAIGSLGLPGCRILANESHKNGFRATQVTVEYEPEHAHRHLSDILGMIDQGRLSDRQKDIARRIFTRLAEAEAKVHGTSVEKVHFHEVGAADSIADIVGTAVGWDILGIERAVASPVPTGTGTVKIAHGRCAIPAPATAELLRGIPLAECSVPFEMTTPTGAAILATLIDSFGPLPAMTVQEIGYGSGQRDLDDRPNVLRLMLGEVEESASGSVQDVVCVLDTNIDDLSGELIGHCITRLWDAGALDVYTTAIQMKKNRPGVQLTVLCRPDDIEQIEQIVFTETSTLGIRRHMADRHTLRRRAHQVETSFGTVDGKLAWLPDGSIRFSPEFDSCQRLARQKAVALRLVYESAQRAFEKENER